MTDDVLGVVTCPQTALDPDEQMVCTVTGTAEEGDRRARIGQQPEQHRHGQRVDVLENPLTATQHVPSGRRLPRIHEKRCRLRVPAYVTDPTIPCHV